jgi:hypothetical protein
MLARALLGQAFFFKGFFMVPIVLYVALSLLVAFVGTGKRGGVLLLFVICLALTPAAGIVVALVARDGKPIRNGENDLAMASPDGKSNANSEGVLARIFRLRGSKRKPENDVALSAPEAYINRQNAGNL